MVTSEDAVAAVKREPDPRGSRWRTIGTGALAGLVAALGLTVVQALARVVLGVSPPTELIGDRVAPLLGIKRFFSLLDLFGGYDQLKGFGVGSATLGQLGVGLFLGVAYAWLSKRNVDQTDPDESGRRPLIVLGAVVAGLWLVSVLVLWPVLGTNYRGLPPLSARLGTLVTMLVSSALFTIVLWLGHRYLTARAGAGEADDHASAPGVGRRSVIVGGVGASLALATGGLGTVLFRRSTFGYDGMQYSGPGIQAITPNDRFSW